MARIYTDEGDLNPPRSITTKRETIWLPPLPDTNTVMGNGSFIAQETRSGKDKWVVNEVAI